MIVALIFYYHMKVNGHEILVSTNTVNLPRMLSRWFRSICVISGFLEMATTHHLDSSLEILAHLYLFLKRWFLQFWKTIGNLSRVPAKCSWILSRHFNDMSPTSGSSENATTSDGRSVVGNFNSFYESLLACFV